ncbi:SapC-like S-layer protein [hydrothermal vent metagenome]|uniref:SapC-like S-layer protein n=1 Tax=hydrothermal vent metagenome TaxID=652676 RepID=A0A160TIR6_9ZZZZ
MVIVYRGNTTPSRRETGAAGKGQADWMSNIVPLDTVAHRDLRVDGTASRQLGDGVKLVSVVLREFALLALDYPILFGKQSDTGAFFCAAMLGFDEEENLFLRPGGGMDGYRPLNMERIPFFATETGLAIDLDSPRVGGPGGERLFDDAGEPAPYLQRIISIFRELRPGMEETRAFIRTMLDLKLGEPVDISVSFDDGVRRSVEGAYTINRDALADLDDAQVVDLFRRGYLHAASLMIGSLNQVTSLARRRNDRLTAPIPVGAFQG